MHKGGSLRLEIVSQISIMIDSMMDKKHGIFGKKLYFQKLNLQVINVNKSPRQI